MELAQLNVARLRAPMDDPMIDDRPILCLWWIPDGAIPTVDEAVERLEHLRAHGPTPTAFTFRRRFEPDDEVGAPGNERDTCSA